MRAAAWRRWTKATRVHTAWVGPSVPRALLTAHSGSVLTARETEQAMGQALVPGQATLASLAKCLSYNLHWTVCRQALLLDWSSSPAASRKLYPVVQAAWLCFSAGSSSVQLVTGCPCTDGCVSHCAGEVMHTLQ